MKPSRLATVTALAAASIGGLVVAPARATSTTAPATATGTTAPATATPGVRGGNLQVEAWGLAANQPVELVAPAGSATAGTTDAQGAVLFRDVAAGAGYQVRAGGQVVGAPVTVLSADHVPEPSLYTGQHLASGFGYITTRDGTTLSANIVLPGPVDKGPYPTVIEYNGYEPSNPKSAAFAQIYNAQGYAYVGVNMRGTGCSGGSFGLFDLNNRLDGYDVVEAVAAQSWVTGVGLVGISYGGISQLYVASTRPPHLKAITPLSVLDDPFRSNSYPGGLRNKGFADQWMGARYEQSAPYGEAWTKDRADAGDAVCAANQTLRLQHEDLVAVNTTEPFFPGYEGQAGRIVAADLVGRIDVPVFLAGAWQDEQTGAHFATMLDKFTSAPHLFVDLTNGGHTDSLSPTSLGRYAEFLALYVADRVPDLKAVQTVAPILATTLYGAGDAPTYTNRFAGKTLAEARAAFEAEPAVRVLLESGGAPGYTPGSAMPNAVLSFPAWPVPSAVTTTWLLGDHGTLGGAAGTGNDSYRADPTALPATDYHGDGNGIWQAKVAWDWQPLPSGTGVGYITAPFTADTVIAGSGSADLWINAGTETDTDLEVTITEVRPDGAEIYVQSGWLRASQRKVDPAASTELRPVQTHTEADAAPLPTNQFALARVELYPVVHAFRAGSRLRVTVDAPGNARPVWELVTSSHGETVQIAHDAAHPSKLVLAVVPGVTVPAAPPACGSLRGQPCRIYTAAANGG